MTDMTNGQDENRAYLHQQEPPRRRAATRQTKNALLLPGLVPSTTPSVDRSTGTHRPSSAHNVGNRPVKSDVPRVAMNLGLARETR